jgi:phosphoglucosamine mutase
MSSAYFGTDGIRGPFGGPLVNGDFAARLGAAAGRWLRGRVPAGTRLPIPVARDTRASGPVLEKAIARGLASEGWRLVSHGVIPTPALSRLVARSGAPLGIVITASHNPAGDNGIKFLGPGGRKLSEADEAAIEALLPASAAAEPARADVGEGGPAALEDYVASASAMLAPGALAGWRIVADTANGSTSVATPRVLRGLGAEVIGLGDRPDGSNINEGVGSEHPSMLAAAVRASGARIGIAHDGDGDRCLLCDEEGAILDGDEILTLLALDALATGRLAARTLVVTVHSNGGVDAAVSAAGGRVVRTPVGDRHVAEGMASSGATLGGESSGHVICSEDCATGDGLAAALRVLGVMARTGRPLSELRRSLRRFPQASSALVVAVKRPLPELPGLAAAIREVESALGSGGRVLVRYSGTEPKLRLLVEGPSDAAARAGLARLEQAARAELTVG